MQFQHLVAEFRQEFAEGHPFRRRHFLEHGPEQGFQPH
jgi:hypothetical protein